MVLAIAIISSRKRIAISIFFLINFYKPVNETRADLVIDECVPILLDDTCKNMYFERD